MPGLDHFGFLATYYERLIPPKKPELLLDLLKIQSGDAVLDAGGGTGRIAGFLQQAGGKVTVADISTKMLQMAAQKPGLKPVCAMVESLPFPDNAFQRELMVDALHHVMDQQQTIAELWRVLAPGGRLVVEEPDIQWLVVKGIALGEKLLLMRSHILNCEEIVGLFAAYPAQIRIERVDFTVLVVVDKPG